MSKRVEAWGLLDPNGELLTFAAFEPDAFPQLLEALLNVEPGVVEALLKNYKPVRVVVSVKEDCA